MWRADGPATGMYAFWSDTRLSSTIATARLSVIGTLHMEHAHDYPDAIEAAKVGSYSPVAKAGGGLVWDAVLEYRVWCHPERGAPDTADGNDYYHAFATYAEAEEFARRTQGAEEPLALILQEEYLDEPEPGCYMHMKERPIAEWPVEFLRRPRRTPRTIPNFLSPNAPPNRLSILRGLEQNR